MSVDINEMAAHLDQRRQAEVKAHYDARATHATTAFLLCFFLGFIGAHRFYLGQWRSGLAHLVLIALGAAGVVAGFLAIAPLNSALFVVGGLLVLASLIWEVIDLGRIDNEIHQRNLLLAEGLIAGALLSDTSIVQEAERRLDEAVHASAAQSQAAAATPAGAATTAGMISLDDLAQARQMAEQSGRAAISYEAVSTFDVSATPEERAGQQPVFAPPTTTTERRVNTQPLPIAGDGAPVVETDTHTHSVDAYHVTDAQETDRVSGPSAAEALGLGAAALGAAGVGFGLAEAAHAHAQPEPLAAPAPEPAAEGAPFAPAEPFAEPPTEPIPAAEPPAFTAFAPPPQAEPVAPAAPEPPAYSPPAPEPAAGGADVTDAGAPAFMEPAADVAFASSYPSFVELPEQTAEAAPVAAEPATQPDIPLYFAPEEARQAATSAVEPTPESYTPPVPDVYSAPAPRPETYTPSWEAPAAPVEPAAAAEPAAPEHESHAWAEAAGLGAVVGAGALAADAWAHEAAPAEPETLEPQSIEPAPMAEPPTQPMDAPVEPAAPKTKRIRVKHRIVVEGQVVREEIVEREIPADADMAAAARQIQMELEQNSTTSPDEIARLAHLSNDEEVEVRKRVEGIGE